MSKILAVLQLPPPLHGNSLINQNILNSPILNKSFTLKVIPLLFAKSASNIGKFSIAKVWETVHITFLLISTIISFKPKIAYLGVAPRGLAFYRDAFFACICKLFSIPIIYHLHGAGFSKKKSSFPDKKLCRLIFSDAYVICLSKLLISDINWLPIQKIFIVHNAIIPKEIHATNKVHPPQFLFLSHYKRAKGVLDFIDALASLHRNRKDFSARLVGADGDITKHELSLYIEKKGLTDIVQVSGPLYENDKLKALCQSHILVFPSINEAFSLVLLEALMCGIPVISTTVGGITEMITPGLHGDLIQPSDVSSLSRKMNNLLDHPEDVKRMGLAAKKHFYNNFTWSIYEKKMKEVFTEVLQLESNTVTT